MKKLLITFLLFIVPAFGQFSWPTYPVNTPTQIFKVMKDNGSGVAVLAVDDSTNMLGINQNEVRTSHGNVQIQPSGASQVLVGGLLSLSMGAFVTADSNGNVVAYAPLQNGLIHCYLGTVVGLGSGSGAVGTYVYVNISPVCSRTSGGSTGGAVSSVFGRTGAVVATNGDYNFTNLSGSLATSQVPTGGSTTAFLNGAGTYTAPVGVVSSVFGRTGAVVATSGDYSVGQVTGAAPLASPAFTGTPTAPTPAPLDNSTTLATTAYQQVGLAASMVGGAMTLVPSAKVAQNIYLVSANGENDLYTVPAGMRASISISISNFTGVSITETPQIKVSGTYYQVLASTATGTAGFGPSPVGTTFGGWPILEAGETFAINTSAAGLNIFGFVVTFKNTEALKSPKLLTLTSGNNTVYTCPVGKIAILTNFGSGGNPPHRVMNATGVSVSYFWYYVPNGSSPSTTNQLGPPLSTATNVAYNSTGNQSALVAGDSLVVNTTSSAAGQVAYIENLEELPFP